jgi:hypothetical protein
MPKKSDLFHKKMLLSESKNISICGKMNKLKKTIAFLFTRVYNYPKKKPSGKKRLPLK